MIPLQFPANIGEKNNQPFMMFTSYESKNAISSYEGTKENPMPPLSSIALYIPPNSLKQTTTSNWEGVEGGALRSGAVGAVQKMLGIGQQDMTATSFTDDVWAVMKGVGMTATGTAAKALDKNTGILSAGAGVAVNNHMAMAYKGPGQFREHEFAFNFFPKNDSDAKNIKDIITDFRNGMLPRTMGTAIRGDSRGTISGKLSRPFFRSPRHWNIEFFFRNSDGELVKGSDPKKGFLFEIKKSVITSMSVNHDPNSIISFHADGSPVQTTFSLTFREIEFPLSDDDKGINEIKAATEKSDPDVSFTKRATSGPNKGKLVSPTTGLTTLQTMQQFHQNLNKKKK